MSKIGFDKKLYIGSFGIICLTIVVIACVNFYQTRNIYLSRGNLGVQNISNVLLKSMELKYNLQKGNLESDMGMLAAEKARLGNIMILNNRTVDLEIRDIDTGKKEQVTIPKLLFGLEFVTLSYTVVDNVAKMTSSEIAVFQGHNERMIKVSTSGKNRDDSRSVGDYYPSGSNVYQKIMKGDSFVFLDRANLTMHLIQPFKDPMSDEVAGAFCVIGDILTPDLAKLIEAVNVNGKGYSFVSDPKGKILVHPDKEYRGLNVQDFQNGSSIMDPKSDFVNFGHKDKKYYAFVNHFKPWDLFFTVGISEPDLMAGINRQILVSSGISGMIALVLGALIIGVMNRQLMGNMNDMAKMAREVSEGNFTYSFVYDPKDAIRDTVESMNGMAGRLAEMIGKLNSGVDVLSSSSGELNRIAEKMSSSSETTVAKINTVAAASEEMSVNMDSVAAAMDQASRNVEIVSSGTSDMTRNIGQVAEGSMKTKEITIQAVAQAKQASDRVSLLGKAAEEIDKVTDTINHISSQTNLLALNATIEAARAGEAGKGFAVVANEIKDLALQTAAATEDIAKKIKAMQEQTRGAVTEIQEISLSINRVDDFVKEFSSAIDLQSTTTGEIAQNIQEVSSNLGQVNVNVSQSSEVSNQVAAEINDVLASVQQINDFSSMVEEKAGVLTEVMVQLQDITAKFKT